MLLALDPSSTTTGWALFDGPKCINSGAIILPDNGWWDVALSKKLPCLFSKILFPNVGPSPSGPLTVLIEDIANRSNRKQFFGPSLFQWAKAVGICTGAALICGFPIKRYSSDWLRGKPYAPCKLAHEKKFRIKCAQAYRQEVTQVDEATAVLFGVWYQTASPSLFEWKPPKKKQRRGDGKLKFEQKTPPAGINPLAQPVVAQITQRPGRRLRQGR